MWNRGPFPDRSWTYIIFIIADLFLGSSIPETFGVPTALEFVRDNVAKNVPLVIREATNDWPAVEKWNSKYFR